MEDLTPRFWEIFWEVFGSLPRQGPGNRASAVKALAMCGELPEQPSVLDLGCGVGGQTLQLAELVSGHITALDSHAPAIESLRQRVLARGLADRVTALVGDMAQPDQKRESFDLVWSEGALYSIGLINALQVCYELLRPGGHLVFTDAIWRKANPPAAVKASFDLDYPTMGTLQDDLAALSKSGFKLVGHFTLPDEAWWDDFYTPMEARVAELLPRYTDDPEATAVLKQVAEEPEMHRRYGEYYAYEFFVVRRCP